MTRSTHPSTPPFLHLCTPHSVERVVSLNFTHWEWSYSEILSTLTSILFTEFYSHCVIIFNHSTTPQTFKERFINLNIESNFCELDFASFSHGLDIARPFPKDCLVMYLIFTLAQQYCLFRCYVSVSVYNPHFLSGKDELIMLKQALLYEAIHFFIF